MNKSEVNPIIEIKCMLIKTIAVGIKLLLHVCKHDVIITQLKTILCRHDTMINIVNAVNQRADVVTFSCLFAFRCHLKAFIVNAKSTFYPNKDVV